MLLHRWRQRLDPLLVANQAFERVGGPNVFNTQLQNWDETTHRALHLAENLRRVVGSAAEYEHHDSRPLNGFDNTLAIRQARGHIARRNPTAHAMRFQRGACQIGHGLVPGRIADEDVVCHQFISWPLELWAFKLVAF
jgi:hypothetical protein